MSTLTTLISQTDLTDKTFERYEVLENQRVSDMTISETQVSGVLFSLSTFTRVHFKNIDFFANRFENCEFIDCTFEYCNFQFSTMIYCDFHRATFIGNHWTASTIKKSLVSHCLLDVLTQQILSPEENRIMGELSAFEQTMTVILEQIAA